MKYNNAFGRLFLIIVLGMILNGTSSFVYASGWGNTNWGMDIQGVEKETSLKVVDCGREFGGKIISHMLKDQVFIGDYRFNVYMNFTNNKLDKVILRLESGDEFSAYMYLESELKKKYGVPSIGPKEDKTSKSNSFKKVEWITDDTLIRLNSVYLRISGKVIKSMNISYYPRKAESADNL